MTDPFLSRLRHAVSGPGMMRAHAGIRPLDQACRHAGGTRKPEIRAGAHRRVRLPHRPDPARRLYQPARPAPGSRAPGGRIACITHSFSRSSPPDGLPGRWCICATGAADAFAGNDVRGKIVLVDGIAIPPLHCARHGGRRDRPAPCQPARASARDVHLAGLGQPDQASRSTGCRARSWLHASRSATARR